MQESIIFIRDAEYEREDANPFDAIVVFVTNPHTELDLDLKIALTGPVVTWAGMCADFFSRKPRVIKFDAMKYVVHNVGKYFVAMSGRHVENDMILVQQLELILETFEYLYGSFDLEKALAGFDRQRFSNRLSTIFQSIFPFFRPPFSNLPTVFSAIKYHPFGKANNHIFVSGGSLLAEALAVNTSMGACISYEDSVICTSFDAKFTTCIAALLESEAAAEHLHENYSELVRKGGKLKQMMLDHNPPLLRDVEYRKTIHGNACFIEELIRFLIQEGEQPNEKTAEAFAGNLLRAGIIQAYDGSTDMRSKGTAYYFTSKDKLRTTAPKESLLGGLVIGRRQMTKELLVRFPDTHVIRIFIPKLVETEPVTPNQKARPKHSDADQSFTFNMADSVTRDEVTPTLVNSSSTEVLKEAGLGAGTSLPQLDTTFSSVVTDRSDALVDASLDGDDLLSPTEFNAVDENHDKKQDSLDLTADRHASTTFVTPAESVSSMSVESSHPPTPAAQELADPITDKPQSPPVTPKAIYQSNLEQPNDAALTPAVINKEVDDAQLTSAKSLDVSIDVSTTADVDMTRASVYYDALDITVDSVDTMASQAAINQEATPIKLRESRGRAAHDAASSFLRTGLDRISVMEVSDKDISGVCPDKLLATLYIQKCGSVTLSILFETLPSLEKISELSRFFEPQLQSLSQDLLDDKSRKRRSTDVVRNADNHVVFHANDESINGWCNTHWSEFRTRLQPDSNVDHVFVDTVQCMHAAFVHTEGERLQEILLKRGSSILVYGRNIFDAQVFLQPRISDVDAISTMVGMYPIHAREQLAKKLNMPYL